MGLRLKTESKNRLLPLNSMNKNDIGIVEESDFDENIGAILIKSDDDVIVCLSDGDAWGELERDTTKVRLLPPGTEFVID